MMTEGLGSREPGTALGATNQFVEIAGDRIAYRSIGTGSPLILLHRFRATMDDWDPAFVDAVASTRRVILFDSSGVGASGGRTPDTLEAAADVAVSLSRALGFERSDFLGWSMGGMTLAVLGSKYPDDVRALIPAGTLPPIGSPELIPSSPEWSAVAGKPTYDDEDILYLFFTATERSRAAGRASLDRIGRRKGGPGNAIGTTAETMGAQYQAIVGHYQNRGGWYERLGGVKAPTLVANGDLDLAFPVIDSLVYAREIRGAQLAIYPDSGHGFLFQHAERFADDIRNFLDALS